MAVAELSRFRFGFRFGFRWEPHMSAVRGDRSLNDSSHLPTWHMVKPELASAKKFQTGNKNARRPHNSHLPAS